MAVVRANQPFAYTDRAGVPRVVRAGDLFSADDPCVKSRPGLFDDVESVAARVEEATAAPGEKRSLPRRARRAAKDAGVDSDAPVG